MAGSLRTVRSLAGLCALGLTMAGCSGVDSSSTTLRFTTMVSEDHPYSLAFAAWMDEVSERTDGQVEFETNFNASLCATTEQLNCVGEGMADIGFAVAAYNPELPLANTGTVAFQVNDPQAAGTAMDLLYAENDDYRAEMNDRNVHVLFHAGDSKSVLASTTELDGLDDLDGYSMRAAGGLMVGLEPLGAKPVAISLDQIYESLERGVVKGALLPLVTQVDQRIGEVASHFYDIGQYTGVPSVASYVINTDTFDGLPEDVKDVMAEVSTDISARYQADFMVPEIEAACAELAEAGLELEPIGPEAAGQAWAEEAGAVLKADWLEAAGESTDDPEGYFEAYLSAVAEAESGGQPTPETIDVCAASSS